MGRYVVRALVATGVGAAVAFACVALPAAAQTRREGARVEKVQLSEPEGATTQATSPAQPSGETPAVRFQATVFQVAVAREKIADLDAKALAAQASTPGALAKALEPFGPVTVLYRVDQAVAADGQKNKIGISRATPYVSGTAAGPRVQPNSSIAREKVGGSFDFSVALPAEKTPRRAQTTLRIELGTMTDSSVQVDENVTAPIFWRVDQSYGGLVALNQPLVLISADGAATAGTSQPLAFVSLVVLSTSAE